MIKALTITIAIILGINCYSQNVFKKGYFINNVGNKIECLIKYQDKVDNPIQFKYKLNEDSETQTMTIESVREFSINDRVKYIRYNVEIDRSSFLISDLDNEKNPIFNTEKLFLKILVEGKANLYSYRDKSLTRFFYKKDTDDVKQLIYKEYLDTNNKVNYNNSFRYQLWNSLKSESISINEVNNTKYEEKELVNLFAEYNSIEHPKFVNYYNLKKKQKKDLFNLTIKPGININSLSIKNTEYLWKAAVFDNVYNYRIGIEAEFILPFNNNKWSISFEPTFQEYKSTNTILPNTIYQFKRIAEIEYKEMEFPLSLRYYMFLSNKSKLYLNGALLWGFYGDSNFKLLKTNGDVYASFNMRYSINGTIGFGFKYANRYSLEIKYLQGKNIIFGYQNWRTKLNTLTISMGYSIF